MLFALICEDASGSTAKRLAARPKHLERIGELQSEGRLVLAGPFHGIESPDPGPVGVTGSLIVAEFASRAEAEAWLAEDPYVTDGVFATVTVRPFRQVAP